MMNPFSVSFLRIASGRESAKELVVVLAFDDGALQGAPNLLGIDLDRLVRALEERQVGLEGDRLPLAGAEMPAHHRRQRRSRAPVVIVVGEDADEWHHRAVGSRHEPAAERPRAHLSVVVDQSGRAVAEGELAALLTAEEIVGRVGERRQEEPSPQALADHEAADLSGVALLDIRQHVHRQLVHDVLRHGARRPVAHPHRARHVARRAGVENRRELRLVLLVPDPLLVVIDEAEGAPVLLVVDGVAKAEDRLQLLSTRDPVHGLELGQPSREHVRSLQAVIRSCE